MKPQFHRNLYLFDGRLSQRIWARGIVTDYSYDGWGSLTNTVYSDATPAVTLFYDAMGRQTNAVDAAGVTTFRYDDYGSLTNETVVGAAGENTIIRHWDVYGRTAGYTLNNVRQTTIGYDAATGRIATMLANGSNVPFTWSYLPGSDLKSSLTYPNGLTASWTYDANSQLLQVRNAVVATAPSPSETEVISQYDYTYDAAGRRIEIARSGTAMSESRTDAYGYNTRNELISATKLGGPASVPATPDYAYQYDDIGNRITSTDLTTNRTYTANSLNQYSAITTSDSGLQTSSFTPQFDDDGNQTLIQTSTGVWSVQYNGEDRPVLWTGGTQSAATNIVMSFDRMGRRVEYRETTGGSQSSATETNAYHCFLYDNYLCIKRLDAANGNTVDLAFVWDVTEPIATRPLIIDKPEVCKACVTHDGNKNVAELFSDNYQVFAHYEYSPFGDVAVSTQTTSAQSVNLRTCNPFRFSSEYSDDILGLVYYNFRHYSPMVGRWTKRDALEEEGAKGLFIYCGNRPTHDILGLYYVDSKSCDTIKTGIDTELKEVYKRLEKYFTRPSVNKMSESGRKITLGEYYSRRGKLVQDVTNTLSKSGVQRPEKWSLDDKLLGSLEKLWADLKPTPRGTGTEIKCCTAACFRPEALNAASSFYNGKVNICSGAMDGAGVYGGYRCLIVHELLHKYGISIEPEEYRRDKNMPKERAVIRLSRILTGRECKVPDYGEIK